MFGNATANVFARARRRRSARPEVAPPTCPQQEHYTARRRERLREMQSQVASWVAEFPNHDPDARAAFDPRIEANTFAWHGEDDKRHQSYLAWIRKRISAADAAIAEAVSALDEAKQARQTAQIDFEQARRRLGGEMPAATVPSHNGSGGSAAIEVVPGSVWADATSDSAGSHRIDDSKDANR
jgi:hypothetical protein